MNSQRPHPSTPRSAALAATLALLLGACSGQALLTPAQEALVKAAQANGASGVKATPREDGGLQLSGRLEGDQFALVFPEQWNHEAMLFAHGYSAPGTPIEVPDNPMAEGKDLQGVFRTPYGQGFVVGHSAYDKAGMDVESAVTNTWRLKQFVDKLGAQRTYLIGASMGGNIVLALVEKYPGEFSGVIAGCGAVGDWPAQLGWMNDVRAAYNHFTKGTDYELPGEKSIARSALSSPSFGLLRMWNMKRLVSPVYELFEAANKDPDGPESRIIDNVAAVADTERDPAAFTLPILTSGMGMDDINATFGGLIFDNSASVYHSPHLSTDENAKLNAEIERVKANPAAVAKSRQWYKSTGELGAPLLSIYNETDSLVPTELHQNMLRDAVAAAGNSDRLVLRSVPPMIGPLPAGELQGLAHCGFTHEQIAGAWNDLRRWAETGQRPADTPEP